MSFFYMSFCDVDRPKGLQFLGATIVEADEPATALAKSHALGINPGGEVAMWEISAVPPEGVHYLHKLVPREQVMAEAGTHTLADEGAPEPTARVCQDCNDG